MGYTVLEAENAEKAMVISEQHNGSIHLLLTDVVMPQMSGLDLARELSAKRTKLKVLFMSGYAEHPAFRDSFQSPGTPIVRKPFSIKNLAANIRDVLNSKA